MQNSNHVFDVGRQAARAVNLGGCQTAQEVADFCHLTVEGAFAVLRRLHRDGLVCRDEGLWLPRLSRPVDDPAVYAAYQARTRKGAETRRLNRLGMAGETAANG